MATEKNNYCVKYEFITLYMKKQGHAVAQFVKALRYISEGLGVDSRWCL